MQVLKMLTRRLVGGLSALCLVGGIGSGIGVLAVATATPAAACSNEPYVGTICTFAMDWCPAGYALADGRALPISQNQALFALLGVLYGGDGTTNFKIPDLRGRAPIGKGQGVGLVNVQIAQPIGQQQLILNTTQVPLMTHTHPATFQGTGGGQQTITIPANAGTLGITSKLLAKQVTGQASATTGYFLGQGGAAALQAPIYVPAATAAATGELGGLEVNLTGSVGNGAISFPISTGITGGNVAVSNNTPVQATAAVSTQPPSMGLSVCIATSGLYPSRP